MRKDNTFAWLAVAALAFLVRTVQAGVEIQDAHAVLSGTEPRSVEVVFTLHNATPHALELLKVECTRADRVDLRLRSQDADGRPRVWPVGKFEVAPGAVERLSSQGRFFRVTGLEPALRTGDRLSLIFTFEGESPVPLSVPLEGAALTRD